MYMPCEDAKIDTIEVAWCVYGYTRERTKICLLHYQVLCYKEHIKGFNFAPGQFFTIIILDGY